MIASYVFSDSGKLATRSSVLSHDGTIHFFKPSIP
jgi:hypothetical protein